MPRTTTGPHRPLNPRQKRFIEEYLQSGNGTRAAIRAGYYVRHAGNTACALLKRPDVQAVLAAAGPAPGLAPSAGAPRPALSRPPSDAPATARPAEAALSMGAAAFEPDVFQLDAPGEAAGELDPAIRELSRLAYANMLDFTRPTHGGGLAIDWVRLNRGHAAGIKELVIEENRTRHGTRQILRIRMADKQAALSRLIAVALKREAIKREEGKREGCKREGGKAGAGKTPIGETGDPHTGGISTLFDPHTIPSREPCDPQS